MSKEKRMIDDLIEIFDEEYNKANLITPQFTADKLIAKGYRKQNGWISVDERLPKEGVDVLVTLKIGDRVSVDTDRIYSGRWFGYSSMRGVSYVTHWMPFPEPPEVVVG